MNRVHLRPTRTDTLFTYTKPFRSTDAERGPLVVKGSVPGAKGGWLLVRDAVKLPRHPEAPYPAGLKSAANTNYAPADAPVEAPVEETVVDTAATDGAQES